jgi:hypothetical protein
VAGSKAAAGFGVVSANPFCIDGDESIVMSVERIHSS